jgi:hypothetical protein
MKLPLFASCLSGALLTGGIAFAHHGWGSYDASKVMTIENPVTRLAWQNPHVHIGVNHEGGTWELVLAPPFRMEARGLSRDLLKVGTPVELEGYPSTQNEHEMRAERLTVAGKTYELR